MDEKRDERCSETETESRASSEQKWKACKSRMAVNVTTHGTRRQPKCQIRGTTGKARINDAQEREVVESSVDIEQSLAWVVG